VRIAGVLLLALGGVFASPQDFDVGGFGPRGRFHVMPNFAYDGRFTFVRVNYETAPGGYYIIYGLTH